MPFFRHPGCPAAPDQVLPKLRHSGDSSRAGSPAREGSAAAGDKIPRKNGAGVCQSDILVINKKDLAPYVGASLEVMDRDSKLMRGKKPFIFTNCKTGEGIDGLIKLIMDMALFDVKPAQPAGAAG